MLRAFLVLSLSLPALSCTLNRGELGSANNPLKFFLIPSVDSKVLGDNSKIMQKYLEEHTPYKFSFSIPNSYIAVVEAFGTKRADFASFNTFGYILAREKYNVEALATVLRFGSDTYKSQIIARTDGPIKKLEDISGKKFAFVDPTSTSGYMLPAKLFREKNIKPAQTVFAQKHDNVVTMLYQKQVDAGATFYSPPDDGKIQDARRLVKTQYPDVEEKIKIIALTQSIPNDPIVARGDLQTEMKKAVMDALMKFMESEEGKKTFYAIYGVNGLKPAKDSDYDVVRGMIKDLNVNVGTLVK